MLDPASTVARLRRLARRTLHCEQRRREQRQPERRREPAGTQLGWTHHGLVARAGGARA